MAGGRKSSHDPDKPAQNESTLGPRTTRSKRSLTPKQQRFAKEYLVDLNATQAAIRAGYSAKTADRIGAQLLGKSWVATAIQDGMAKREKRTEITQDRVIQQLAKIALADIKDFVEWDDNGIRIRGSAEVDGSLLAEVSENLSELGGRTIKIKRHDAMKALELLGRHLGIFNDRVQVAGQLQITFVEDLSE